ncbi:hypothetical protein [Roseateles sp.]|uniref:hypothetical protein n=1 Tax=Roseateles sp. TaxID=1971397 RepID=UPI002F3F3EE1
MTASPVPTTDRDALVSRIANAVLIAQAAGDQHHLAEILQQALRLIQLQSVEIAGQASAIGHLSSLVDELRANAPGAPDASAGVQVHRCPGQRGVDVRGCWHVRCQLGRRCINGAAPQGTPR